MPTIRAKITTVQPEPRSYETRGTTYYSVEGEFADGSAWSSATTKLEYAKKRIADLLPLKDKEEEYEVETRPDYKGKKQWKLIAWPGRPAPGGPGGGGKAGGGGGWQARFRDTEAGFLNEQDSIRRSVALAQAVAHVGPGGRGDDVLTAAGMFYDWLLTSTRNRTFPTKGQEEPASPSANANMGAAPAALPASDHATSSGSVGRSGGQPNCPQCGKSDAVFKSKKEGEGWYCWNKKGGCGHNWRDGEQLLPAVSNLSVLEQAFQALDGYTRILDVVECSKWIKEEHARRVLENPELYKLDKYSSERAIGLARTDDDFLVAEGFIRQLRSQNRFGDNDVAHHLGKLEAAKSREEMKRRF